MAADYAKVREQFGRVIATFQAVKHHCANMAVADRGRDRDDVGRRRAPRRPAATSAH